MNWAALSLTFYILGLCYAITDQHVQDKPFWSLVFYAACWPALGAAAAFGVLWGLVIMALGSWRR